MTAHDDPALLADNAAEAGIAWTGPPPVRRQDVALADGRRVSALIWGGGSPGAVLLHGRAQNAHTWDTVGLALRAIDPERSFAALDLPGHGHSAWREDHDYGPFASAPDVAAVADEIAPAARLLVGMSLGGLTSLALLDAAPTRVDQLILVDITPGVGAAKTSAITAFTSGPERFASLEEIVERTIRHNPGRSEASLRRGVMHNAHRLPDGSWAWRWDPQRAEGPAAKATAPLAPLWDVLSRLRVPVTLVRGGASPVVDDADVVELRRRRPDAEVVVVEGAGHSVQGDRPLALANIIASRWPS